MIVLSIRDPWFRKKALERLYILGIGSSVSFRLYYYAPKHVGLVRKGLKSTDAKLSVRLSVDNTKKVSK